MPNFILYQNLTAEDFLTAYKFHRERGEDAYLPPARLLRDFKLSGRVNEHGVSYAMEIFFVLQYDMINDTTSSYVLLRSESAAERELEKMTKRFRIDLRAQKFTSLFRIDPRYGLVVGASRDSLDPAIRMDRNHCFITLYLTDDFSHPEISLLEYVDRDRRNRFKTLFQSLNHGLPKKKGIMGFDIQKLRAGGLKGEADSPFTYEHVRYFASVLGQRYTVYDLKISLVFKDMSERDLQRGVIDASKGLFYPTGECRFFNSTEELLA